LKKNFKEMGEKRDENHLSIIRGLFSTVTNVNFDDDKFVELITEGLQRKEEVKKKFFNLYKKKKSQRV